MSIRELQRDFSLDLKVGAQHLRHKRRDIGSKTRRMAETTLAIEQALAGNPRGYCLFVLGINTAVRVSELLSIRVGHIRYL